MKKILTSLILALSIATAEPMKHTDLTVQASKIIQTNRFIIVLKDSPFTAQTNLTGIDKPEGNSAALRTKNFLNKYELIDLADEAVHPCAKYLDVVGNKLAIKSALVEDKKEALIIELLKEFEDNLADPKFLESFDYLVGLIKNAETTQVKVWEYTIDLKFKYFKQTQREVQQMQKNQPKFKSLTLGNNEILEVPMAIDNIAQLKEAIDQMNDEQIIKVKKDGEEKQMRVDALKQKLGYNEVDQIDTFVALFE